EEVVIELDLEHVPLGDRVPALAQADLAPRGVGVVELSDLHLPRLVARVSASNAPRSGHHRRRCTRAVACECRCPQDLGDNLRTTDPGRWRTARKRWTSSPALWTRNIRQGSFAKTPVAQADSA